MTWKRAGAVAALAAALPLSGCAAAMSGYDTGPDGLPREEESLRRELATRPAEAYASILDGEVALPDDDLIRLLFAGTAGRYAGAPHESGHLLDLAAYLAEDRVTIRVSQQALSMVTSDRALAYTPGTHERLMIHYHAAAGYLEAGDLDAAAVEARRIEAALDRAGADGREIEGRAFLHTLAGVVFEAAGYIDDADVSYRRAEASRARARSRSSDTGAATVAAEDAGDRVEASRPSDAGEAAGEVVVLVESGHVPHRVEQSVVVVVPSWQVARLKDGDAGAKASAALDAATRVLFGAHGGYYRDYGFRHPLRLAPWDDCDDCEDADEDPYLLRISWPVLYQPPGGPGDVRVRAGDREGETVAQLDVAWGARRDFDAERATTLARTLARAASKVALTSAAREAVEEKDETAGRIVGWLTNLGTALTERADTRSWHLLPGDVRLVRLTLPAGRHDLELMVRGRAVPLGAVDVAAGRTTFVTHRVWD